MRSIYDKEVRAEIIGRINSLGENNTASWGKMNVAQMVKHCAMWDEMALGKTRYKQSFLGKLLGRVALKDMMKDEPMKKNLPTVPSFKISGPVDFAPEKKKWLSQLDEYEHSTQNGILHPFFGTMTKEQTGIMVYKHIDHHLRQFNA